ncbi:pyroglutamyl-peptidase I [Garicola koreensis]|uniref:pyroglutamyl-peptidase I family protein n=1 Tax=Garicola koreensis TaxID=1262554 RepID=UPI0031E52A89
MDSPATSTSAAQRAQGPPRILLTDFEPFGGSAHNSSGDVVSEVARRAAARQLLTQQEHDDVVISTLTLPVEFGAAGHLLTTAAQQHRPDVVISVGLAAGAATLRLERVGLNLRDARIPDNAGAQPLAQPIIAGAENAHFSTLRLKAAQQRIAAAGIPVSMSLSAGTFVCNEVLFTILDHISAAGLPTSAGFVHVPDLRAPDRHSSDSPLSLPQVADAVDLVISESLKPIDDVAGRTGTLH